MKHIFFSILFLAGTTCALSQQRDSLRPFTAEDYLIKSNAQKNGAWVLTVAGSAGLIATLLANAGDAVTGVTTTLFSAGTVQPEHHSYLLPYLLSSAGIGSGLALFVGASKNKRKSINFSPYLKMEKMPVVHGYGIILHHFPSIAMQIKL